MTDSELQNILENHEKWLMEEVGGRRADLSGVSLLGVNLRGVDLCKANMREVNLSGANLTDANLQGADLSMADLYEACLYGANLVEADLHGSDLRRACLIRANLCEADMHGTNMRGVCLHIANLRRANLNGANLCAVDLSEADLSGTDLREVIDLPYIPMACPDSGSFIGWKKACHQIVKLQILEDSLRSSSTGRKCRCNKALVLAIENIDGSPSNLKSVCSNFDESFVYTVGEIVESDFCMDRFMECAAGIHFFVNRQEAVDYS